jgi:protein TonB
VSFASAISEPVRRRLFSGAMALAINAVMISAILFAPRDALPTPADEAVDVILVQMPIAAEDPPEVELPVEEDPVEETAPEPTAEPEATQLAEITETIEVVPPPPSSSDATDQEEEDETRPSAVTGLGQFSGETLPFPGGPGSTEYAVREIFCLSTSDANRDAMSCPPSTGEEGLPMLRYASEENIEAAKAAALLSDMEIRTLFAGRGLPVRDLTGQPTVDDPTTRATSSADQMRDTLPPLHPDPGFGD